MDVKEWNMRRRLKKVNLIKEKYMCKNFKIRKSLVW